MHGLPYCIGFISYSDAIAAILPVRVRANLRGLVKSLIHVNSPVEIADFSVSIKEAASYISSRTNFMHRISYRSHSWCSQIPEAPGNVVM